MGQLEEIIWSWLRSLGILVHGSAWSVSKAVEALENSDLNLGKKKRRARKTKALPKKRARRKRKSRTFTCEWAQKNPPWWVVHLVAKTSWDEIDHALLSRCQQFKVAPNSARLAIQLQIALYLTRYYMAINRPWKSLPTCFSSGGSFWMMINPI